jgi:alkylation response protein AidB-like acyl-CoA dehydrogenase
MDFDLTPDQHSLQERARELAHDIATRAAEIDRSEEYPWDNVERLKAAGFFGMTIPRVYGGLGFTCLDAILVIEQVAKTCGITARIVVEANRGRSARS